MKVWHTATVPMPCGGCAHGIATGDPYLEYRLAAVARPLLRCRACAGEPPAHVLPFPTRPALALPEWTPIGSVVRTFPVPRQANATLQARIDARIAALRGATARDPGEEG